MYRRLQVDQIVVTAERLGQRVTERFPDSGLSKVAERVVEIARGGQARLDRLRRPFWALRTVAGAGILLAIALAVAAVILAIRLPHEIGSRADVFQAILALVDEMVLLGVAILFLMGLEGRAKRSTALEALYELRSMAHVIDMHQLTKDPEHILYRGESTQSSPARSMSRFELGRYLDYCSELLSLTSKMAALHVQDLKDPVVLGAVRDVESLTGALQGKIWQKKQIQDAEIPRRVRARSGIRNARSESRPAAASESVAALRVTSDDPVADSGS